MTPTEAFAARMAAFFTEGKPKKLTLAVSGGGDSMALLHLAADWSDGVMLDVVTVDHGLRPESAQEAEFVHETATALGLRHQTLRWTGWNGQGNLQNVARLARRHLIEAHAAESDAILTGHTGDDQAETVLMRLARGSGVDGLAGMAARERHGQMWLRPLLDQRRADLRDYLRDRGAEWVDDPSNDDLRFERIKARQLLHDLDLNPDRLIETARHMRAARQVLQAAVVELARDAVNQDHGDVLIDRAVFTSAPADTRTRLLAAALCWVSRNPYKPRFNALSELAETGQGTLHGCQIKHEKQHMRVMREYNAIANIHCQSNALWDNRWYLCGPHEPGLTIGALGEQGIRQAANHAKAPRPYAALLATPSIWRKDTLISAPFAGYSNGWIAELAPDCGDFYESLISH